MKKSNFILSLISIFLPIGLVILFFIEVIVDSIDNFKLNSFHDFLFTHYLLIISIYQVSRNPNGTVMMNGCSVR